MRAGAMVRVVPSYCSPRCSEDGRRFMDGLSVVSEASDEDDLGDLENGGIINSGCRAWANIYISP